MWDPITIFYLGLSLNLNSLPAGRLDVIETIEDRENKIIVERIASSVSLREGI